MRQPWFRVSLAVRQPAYPETTRSNSTAVWQNEKKVLLKLFFPFCHRGGGVWGCESRTDYRVWFARRKTHTAKSVSGPAKTAGEPQMPGRGLNQKTVATCGVFVTSPGETTRCCPCTTDPHCYPASALARPTKGRARAKSTSITHTHPT